MVMPRAEIICVGTELLMGDTVNSNAAFLGRQCAGLGINLYHQSVVGDNRQRLLDSLNLAAKRSNLILLSGGLGPTEDDLTKETVAEFLGLDLQSDERVITHINRYFEGRQRSVPTIVYKQSQVPEGAEVFLNPNGTAPGLFLQVDGRRYLLLPGPPIELQALFKMMRYRLQDIGQQRLYSRTYRLLGIGESQVADLIADLISNQTDPTIAPYAKTGEVHLRVTATRPTLNQAEQAVECLGKIIEQRLADYIYSTTGADLTDVIIQQLREKGQTVAVAESCTGGLLAYTLVEKAGASSVFGLGKVTYANQAKVKELGVPVQCLQEHGAVSQEVALAMADGIRSAGQADYGLAITGIAGPTGQTEDKPLGLTYIALANRQGHQVWRYVFKGERQKRQQQAVKMALIGLYRHLREEMGE